MWYKQIAEPEMNQPSLWVIHKCILALSCVVHVYDIILYNLKTDGFPKQTSGEHTQMHCKDGFADENIPECAVLTSSTRTIQSVCGCIFGSGGSFPKSSK